MLNVSNVNLQLDSAACNDYNICLQSGIPETFVRLQFTDYISFAGTCQVETLTSIYILQKIQPAQVGLSHRLLLDLSRVVCPVQLHSVAPPGVCVHNCEWLILVNLRFPCTGLPSVQVTRCSFNAFPFPVSGKQSLVIVWCIGCHRRGSSPFVTSLCACVAEL